MYRPSPTSLYPRTILDSLPSWRLCLLAFVAGVVIAWLYSSGWLWPALGGLLALSFASFVALVACMFVGGKKEE